MKKLCIYFLLACLAVVLLAAAAAGGAWTWVNRSLDLPAERVEFIVAPGSTPRAVARAMNDAGIPIWEDGFAWLARLSEREKLIKAGGYERSEEQTPELQSLQ